MATHLRIWLNLDADLELEDPQRYRPAADLGERLSSLLPKLAGLLAADDVLLNLEPGQRPTSPLPAISFCPTPSAITGAADAGYTLGQVPALEVLRTVNHRAFCAALGQTLERASLVHELEALLAVVRGPSPTGSFVIKRPHSFAGRDRRLCHHGQLDPSTLGFVRNALARGESLQVEPWVERAGDFSLHGYVLPGGRALLGEPRALHCDRMGRFETSSALSAGELSAAEAAALAHEGERVATALHGAGYAGPFGIDAFRYRDGRGKLAFNPRCEINARLTMGYPRALLLESLRATAEGA